MYLTLCLFAPLPGHKLSENKKGNGLAERVVYAALFGVLICVSARNCRGPLIEVLISSTIDRAVTVTSLKNDENEYYRYAEQKHRYTIDYVMQIY